MTSPRVVLVGIPASGKSSVGAALAQAWGVELIDTDLRVADQLGGSVTELLASVEGEAAFRAAEEELALAALASGAVVALGSGAVAAERVRSAMAGLPVVWLRTTVVTATRRLGLARFGMDVLAAIRTTLDAQLEQRAVWYAQVASSVIDTDRLSIEAIVEQIAAMGEGS